MANLKIAIWYNQNNNAEVKFSEAFANNLQKCVKRYLPQTRIDVVFNEPGALRNFLVISEIQDDTKLAQLPPNNIYALHIEPNNDKLQIATAGQYLFWERHTETDEVLLYEPTSKYAKAKYWEKITDIAIEIEGEILGDDKKKGKPKVYLSVDDNYNNPDRENLKRDLTDLGYDVLPSSSLSAELDQCTQQIDEALSNASLVIHIIPPVYKIHFPENHLSLTELQCDRSAIIMQSENPPQRVISSAFEIADEENQIFVEKIQRDPLQSVGTVVLKSSIEDLKKHYKRETSGDNPFASEQKSVDVYLVSDCNNLEKEVVSALKEQRVAAPSQFKRLSFTQHLNLLGKANSVILCYSSSNPQWLAVKANDILKSRGVDLAKQFKRVVLFKSHKNLEVDGVSNVFTDVVTSVDELNTIFKQSSNN